MSGYHYHRIASSSASHHHMINENFNHPDVVLEHLEPHRKTLFQKKQVKIINIYLELMGYKLQYNTLPLKDTQLLGFVGCSLAKSIWCFCAGLKFGSQHTCHTAGIAKHPYSMMTCLSLYAG